MDTYYEGTMMDDEDHILEWRTGGLSSDVVGAFIVTLAVSITLMAFLRLTSYVSFF
ncbi:hypothetical protein J2755_000520 [Methanohalophilus levihalophilus]|uniref:hypothetical protein n=1 Tax=Methanohalophilus levihalophilus TaxID=1431282 RepID=UPI001AE96A05|nr:hypothetical protein [Methanohalophilus levihalophilus]MBP2029600.1 hypothetical protein [Methanohalophilus levihalophilus]